MILLLSLIPYGNHAQLEGGSVAERLRSTLVYSWVECCSDISKEVSLLFNLCNYNCLMNYDEHVECLN